VSVGSRPPSRDAGEEGDGEGTALVGVGKVIFQPMNTESDYKTRHIPHRINLLITYRERFVKLTAKQRDQVRDLDRCAKDMSAMMVRFFLGEMGIRLTKGVGKVPEESKKEPLNAKRLTVSEMRRDGHYDSVFEVLKFANRAIAHLEPADVDHNFQTAADDDRLVEAIDYTEAKVIRHIYGTHEEYVRFMKLDDNDMHRERLDLSNVTAQLVKKGSKPISA